MRPGVVVPLGKLQSKAGSPQEKDIQLSSEVAHKWMPTFKNNSSTEYEFHIITVSFPVQGHLLNCTYYTALTKQTNVNN